MILNSPYISGSLTVTGNIIASGSITISGSIASASYASNADLLDGLDSTAFATTGAYSATSASLYATSASLSATSGSLSTASGSFNTRVTALEATGSALSSSLLTVSGSGYATSASLSTASGSFNSRVATIESKYATTGSNNFRAPQYVSDTTVPTGFSNTTGSIYTDGGIQVTKDSYFSGSMFIKGNLTIYGTQSIAYITSSQLNIATNLITVNTATPAVRFGGLAVYDSGSTGTNMTGSLLWDSQNNSWIYDNPSGSGNYDSAMVIMGPRNASALGSEQGLSCNYLIQGHGHHHTTSSVIFHDGTNTCIPNTLKASIGCFASNITTNSPGGGVNSATFNDRTGAVGAAVDQYGTLAAYSGILNSNGVYGAGSSGTALVFNAGAVEQFRISATNMTVVGNVTAGAKFETSFSNTNTSFDNNSYVRLVNTGTSTLNQRVDLILRWADGTYNGTGGISMVRESATARSGKLVLQPIGSDGNNLEALTLASTGAATFSSSVTATGYNFSGTGAVLQSTASVGTSSQYGLFYNNGGVFYWGKDDASGSSFGVGAYSTVLWNSANSPIVFGTTNTERMRITSGGYVGINTTSPGTWLDVKGIIRSTTGGLQIGKFGYAANPQLSIGLDQPGFGPNAIVNGWGNSSNGGIAVGTTRSDGYAFTVNTGVTMDSNWQPSAAGTYAFVVTGDGKVGAGICVPRSQFDIGNIHDGYGGSTFCYISVSSGVWSTFACVTDGDSNVITDITFVNGNDYNRSGAFYGRWAYNASCAALHIVNCVYNWGQNVNMDLRNSSGALQICLSGGYAVYKVQARVQGSRATG